MTQTVPLATSEPTTTHRPSHWIAMGAGIAALSTGSVLVRLAAAPAFAVGAYRMALATLLLTPWALPQLVRQWPTLTRHDRLLLGLAGIALGIHFATWISSLALTTVASSVILVNTNPLFVGLISHLVLHERIGRRRTLAIAIAFAGSVIVGLGDLGLAGRALVGDALALVGALAASAYILLGRALRRRLSTLAYVWPCYGVAGLLLLTLCMVTGQPLAGYNAGTYVVFLALAVVPQILGHSTINWALAHFTPVFVTVAILGEPIGATLLAFGVLSEIPPLTAGVGGALILAGIVLAARSEAG